MESTVHISESKSMMRLPSLSKSKSEVIGQSGHCSARLLERRFVPLPDSWTAAKCALTPLLGDRRRLSVPTVGHRLVTVRAATRRRGRSAVRPPLSAPTTLESTLTIRYISLVAEKFERA